MMLKYAIALVVLIVLAAVFAWAFLPARHLPGNRARHLRIRLHLRLHPGKGFAHLFSLWLRWCRFAVLRRSGRIRPALPWRYRIAGPGRALGVPGPGPLPAPPARPAGRAPAGRWPRPAPIRPPSWPMSSCATPARSSPPPPRPTSTSLTSAVRAQQGRVHVFNPQHIGGVPSTFCWDPVAGCEDPATAIRRADAFAFAVSQKGVEDGTFWSAKASDYLRGYFHAAALARYDLRAVAAWVAGADPDVPERILIAAGAHQWAHTLAELRSEAHKTAATVRMVMSRSLAFMADPALAASVLPGPGDGFDIPAFLDGTGTVYLIAEAVSEDAPVAPLFAAMATEIHWIAAQIGQASPSGRLDPPLLMGLDEVTQICPVPLPFWLSDSGGKGIQVAAVVHGEAQLAERWGDYGRQVVLDTSSVKVFLPGITDVTTLQAASTLCGQASWKVRGQDHATRHDVATPDMIRQLPAGFALVIRGGCAPVIARLPRAWKNRAYRRARRLGLAPWHAIAELPVPRRSQSRACLTTCPPNGSAATAPPSPGAEDDQPRPDHRHRRPARRPRRADHPARGPPGRASRRGQRAAGRAHRPGRRPRPRRPGEHAAALTQLAAASPAGPDPDGYCPGPAPAWWKLAAADRSEPVARLRAWVEQVYRPGYGHLAAGLGPAGPPTTCACTGWTSQPSCGRCCTCSPPAPPPWSPPRPNTRPASCPPWPTSSAPRPTAAATRATPHRPAAGHDRRHAPPGPGLRRPRLAGPALPARAEDPRHRARLPRRHHRRTADHRVVRQPPGLEPGHRHRRPRPRRPGHRRPRPGRQRVRRVPPAAKTPGCWTARPPTCAPPAAACTPTSPARASATATWPRTTWTSAPQAATS